MKKIIFKCVNSVVGPSFNENFAEKSTYRSRKQCTGPTIQKCIAGKRPKCAILWPPSPEILFKLTHEINTKSLPYHYCIPFAKKNKNLETILWTIHKTG